MGRGRGERGRNDPNIVCILNKRKKRNYANEHLRSPNLMGFQGTGNE
jgi:hypothetical protein